MRVEAGPGPDHDIAPPGGGLVRNAKLTWKFRAPHQVWQPADGSVINPVHKSPTGGLQYNKYYSGGRGTAGDISPLRHTGGRDVSNLTEFGVFGAVGTCRAAVGESGGLAELGRARGGLAAARADWGTAVAGGQRWVPRDSDAPGSLAGLAPGSVGTGGKPAAELWDSWVQLGRDGHAAAAAKAGRPKPRELAPPTHGDLLGGAGNGPVRHSDPSALRPGGGRGPNTTAAVKAAAALAAFVEAARAPARLPKGGVVMVYWMGDDSAWPARACVCKGRRGVHLRGGPHHTRLRKVSYMHARGITRTREVSHTHARGTTHAR